MRRSRQCIARLMQAIVLKVSSLVHISTHIRTIQSFIRLCAQPRRERLRSAKNDERLLTHLLQSGIETYTELGKPTQSIRRRQQRAIAMCATKPSCIEHRARNRYAQRAAEMQAAFGPIQAAAPA